MTSADPVHAPPARRDRVGPAIAVLALVLAVAAAAAQLVVPWDVIVLVATVLQAAGAATFTVISLRRRRTEPDRGWTAFAVFGACWFVGRALLLTGGVPTTDELGLGTVADSVLWAVGIPVGLYGIHRQCFGDLPVATRRRVFSDAVVSGLATLLIGWVVYHHIAPTGVEPSADPLLVYPAAMLLGAALLVTAGVVQPGRPRPWWLAAGCATGVVVMASVIHMMDVGRPARGAVIAAGLVATPLLMVGFAAVPEGPRSSGAPPPLRGAVRLVIYVPAAFALAAGLFEVVAHGGMSGVAGVLGLLLAAAVTANHRLVMGEAAAQLDRAERSERRYRITFDRAPVGMVVAEVDGTILEANAAAEELMGGGDSVSGRNVEEFYDPAGRTDRLTQRHRLRAGEVARYSHETRAMSQDGTDRWVRVTVSGLNDDLGVRGIAVVEDVTDRRQAQERLRHLAEHDELTGLLNRRGLDRVLAEVLPRSTESVPAAVLLVDLDQFKLLNDSLGHVAGDGLLVACARRLDRAVDGRGTVARFGGDEFCIVLDPADPAGQEAAARDVVAGIQGPVALPEGDSHPTVSVGGVLARDDSTGASLLSEADEALYRAKARGRNRVEWYGRSEIARSHYDQRILNDLHRALADGGLEVYHQPVVDVADGSVTGTEALVRWHHPTLGTLAPAQFLPVAEKSGLMTAIGRRVLADACAAAATWPVAGPGGRPLSVSVNLAPQQLLEPGFVLEVGEVLRATGLDPGRLWLEITESALMQDVATAERTLADLRGLGVHLALDDFGTGYSSLTYLKQFPVEAIKIDRTFVDGLGVDGGDTTIVSALVGLGRQLGLSVVAEGVESTVQWRILQDLRCTAAQGYLFGAPMPVEEVVALLTVPAPEGTGS